MQETIIIISYDVYKNFIGYDDNLDENGNAITYPEGTFNGLRLQPHPALVGLNVTENAAYWVFFSMDTGEMIYVDENGIMPNAR